MPRLVFVSIIVSLTLALDQLSKQWAMKTLMGTPMRTYLWDVFRFQYAENNGAFLSLGSSLPESTRFWIFTVLVSGFLIGLAWVLISKDNLNRWDVAAYALVLGGGIGNLIDRWARGGNVVDFMNMGIGWLRTGIFNVADAIIMAGMFILLGRAMITPHKHPGHSNISPSHIANSNE